MIQQVTRGIKISVVTSFKGSYVKNYVKHFAFSYHIKIENQGKNAVQLLTRHWKIMEGHNTPQYVNGAGVVGKKPVLNPGELYEYSSGCLLTSPLGAMKGSYIMIDFSSAKKFHVDIPSFKLAAPFVLN